MISTFLWSVPVVVVSLALIVRQVERWRPIEWNMREIVSDWLVTTTTLALSELVHPLTRACATAIISMAGGGLIHLRTDGWWYVVSVLVWF
jgi:hypothetical protein